MEQHDSNLAVLMEIARDLTSSLAASDRYARFLSAVTRVIPCDAACLLRLEGDDLVPVAGRGLASEALVRRFDRREHPRLDVILRSADPVLFPADSDLADPFDGLLSIDHEANLNVHACLGCRLTLGTEVVGALTADALQPQRFDGVDLRVLGMLGALAGAAMQTTTLIESLELVAERRGEVARELYRSAGAGGGQILGGSAAVRRLLDEIRTVAASDLPVLITGETGVGKELVARQIHDLSKRHEEAMIQVNCAALPESVAESELFGHVKGAFTGAVRDRAGKFEIARGGTLFLDEVGELPLSLQPKLLRAIQHGEVQRVGSDRPVRVDVRLIAATNRDIAAELETGRFRADLYHRLAVYPIHVPPLRDHREDIPILSAHFLDVSRQRLGLGPVRLAESARERLMAADWPGNIRELENVISRGVLRAARGETGRGQAILVGTQHLDLGTAAQPAAADLAAADDAQAENSRLSLADRVDAFRRRAIVDAVARHGGNWAAAARDLGLHRSNLHQLAARLGLRVRKPKDSFGV
ncbi:MAG: nitric oxide reductase transcriptional regulator NorR [Deltaproteobacteria bacterium]|nr:nitric oxide reductase transcriptional regulator NorR [Deltaproteobacteria bacterium]